jgi:hypothetical protein
LKFLKSAISTIIDEFKSTLVCGKSDASYTSGIDLDNYKNESIDSVILLNDDEKVNFEKLNSILLQFPRIPLFSCNNNVLINKYKNWISSQQLTLPPLNLTTLNPNFLLDTLVKERIQEIYKKIGKNELKKIYFLSDVELFNERTDNIINVVVNEKSFVKNVKSFLMSFIGLTEEERKITNQK